MQYIQIDNVSYYIDMDAASDYILRSVGDESTVTQSYSMDGDKWTPVSREVIEGRNVVNSSVVGVRYELITKMIDLVCLPTIVSDDGYSAVTTNLESLSMGQRVALNTLIKYGIIKDAEE